MAAMVRQVYVRAHTCAGAGTRKAAQCGDGGGDVAVVGSGNLRWFDAALVRLSGLDADEGARATAAGASASDVRSLSALLNKLHARIAAREAALSSDNASPDNAHYSLFVMKEMVNALLTDIV